MRMKALNLIEGHDLYFGVKETDSGHQWIAYSKAKPWPGLETLCSYPNFGLYNRGKLVAVGGHIQ
jgi:hypothetical protein